MSEVITFPDSIRELPPRWQATIHYQHGSGVVPVVHRFEELEELHDIVERGPNFYCIKIEIVLNRHIAENTLTFEERLGLLRS